MKTEATGSTGWIWLNSYQLLTLETFGLPDGDGALRESEPELVALAIAVFFSCRWLKSYEYR